MESAFITKHKTLFQSLCQIKNYVGKSADIPPKIHLKEISCEPGKKGVEQDLLCLCLTACLNIFRDPISDSVLIASDNYILVMGFHTF